MHQKRVSQSSLEIERGGGRDDTNEAGSVLERLFFLQNTRLSSLLIRPIVLHPDSIPAPLKVRRRPGGAGASLLSGLSGGIFGVFALACHDFHLGAQNEK